MRSPSSRVLADRVDIYRATATQDRAGRYVPSYPSVPTYSSIPCTAQPGGYVEYTDQGVITTRKEWRFMFGETVAVRPRDKIVFTDTRGVSHTVYAEASRDEAGRGMAMSVKGSEVTS